MILEQGKFFGRYLVTELFTPRKGRQDAIVTLNGLSYFLSLFELPAEQRTAFLAQADRNAQLLTRLNIRELAKIIESGQEGELPYIIQSLPVGKRLSADLSHYQQPFNALQLVRRLAVVALNSGSADLLPARLTPEQIVIQEKGGVRIIDWGVPHWDSADVPPYRPPEYNPLKQTEQGLIYSLGLLLYQLFAQKHPIELGWQAQESPRPIPPLLDQVRPGLSADSYEAVQTATRTQDWSRYKNLTAFIQALDKAILNEYERGGAGIKLLDNSADELNEEVETQIAPIQRLSPQRRRLMMWLIPLVLFVGLSIYFLGIFSKAETEKAIALTPTATMDMNPENYSAELVAPLPDQSFRMGQTIFLAWNWPLPLSAEQKFVVRVTTPKKPIEIEATANESQSDFYRVAIEQPLKEGEYSWELFLETDGELLKLTQSPSTFIISGTAITTP